MIPYISPVVVGLEGAGLVESQVLGLFVGELSQMGVERRQVQARHVLICERKTKINSYNIYLFGNNLYDRHMNLYDCNELKFSSFEIQEKNMNGLRVILSRFENNISQRDK